MKYVILKKNPKPESFIKQVAHDNSKKFYDT